MGSKVKQIIGTKEKETFKGVKKLVNRVTQSCGQFVTGIVETEIIPLHRGILNLYCFMKTLEGEKKIKVTTPFDFFDGLFIGMKFNNIEQSDGLTGVFKKPCQRYKKEGGKGFIKGLGNSILCAGTSQFTAFVGRSSNLADGILQSTQRVVETRKMKRQRFRNPRYFGQKKILEEYNEQISNAQHVLYQLEKGKYQKERLLFSFNMQDEEFNDGLDLNILFSSKYLLLIEKDKVLASIELAHLKICEIRKKKGEQIFYLYFSDAQHKNNMFITSSYNKLATIFNFVEELPRKNKKKEIGKFILKNLESIPNQVTSLFNKAQKS